MAIQAQMYSENLGFPLGCPQDLLVDNGCGLDDFCFNLQQQQQPQQKQRRLHPNMQFQQLQYMPESNHNRFLRPEDRPMVFSQNMESQIEKQAKEIDLLISLQVGDHSVIISLNFFFWLVISKVEETHLSI